MQFNFKEDYWIENEAIELSPLKEYHIDLLFEVSQSKEIWKYFLKSGYGRENFEHYVLDAIQKRNKGLEYPFVIRDKKWDKYVGMTRIYEVNNELKNAKIGRTWLGEESQEIGLNKNCKYLLFEFLFDKMQMRRIGIMVTSENTRSVNAILSVGFKKEGVFRSYQPSVEGSKRIDILLMSILSEEWNINIKEELRNKIKVY